MSFTKDVWSSSWLRSWYFYNLPKFIHECVDCVCEQAQLTEVSSQQQIGARSRTSEGVSISLWTTWLGVTSPAPGDWRRKGAIKPPRYYHQPYQTTSPDKMAVRSFPQASIKLSEGNFSRLSDHHHHHQVSSAPDQLTSYILYIYTLLIWMVLSTSTWGEETTTPS